ncbi:MAG: hypothetical protein AAF447_12505, partial [Myxococcota bacterium]
VFAGPSSSHRCSSSQPHKVRLRATAKNLSSVAGNGVLVLIQSDFVVLSCCIGAIFAGSALHLGILGVGSAFRAILGGGSGGGRLLGLASVLVSVALLALLLEDDGGDGRLSEAAGKGGEVG